MSKIRIICVDLDGTLLRDDHSTIPPENLEAIREAAAAGVAVVPATGRILGRLPDAVRQIPEIRYAIVVNGAEVVDLADGSLLHSAYLPMETALRIVARGQQLSLTPEVYQDGRMLIQRDDLQLLQTRPIERDHLQYLLRHETPLEDLQAHLRSHPHGICKVNLPYFLDEDLRGRLRAELEAAEEVEAATSMDKNLELNAKGASKGAAVRALCRALGAAPEEVMAIGDGDNDRELLAAVGYPVAMGNAPPQLRALARRVTGTNEEGGVAMAIRAALKGEL
ncbi:HAD family phosphatase [Anaerofilum sp. BX8]|uniref:HAD family phosphatase n=1 Tax=Anaerofilum hominis TaxID=2763016 RepID=A0A923KVD3_9FIRM|nr:HAD family hydrolase [Anaerofilum hominis]MBC5580671.1 HAD family phosphatase [Anaerofilum hominis]